MSDPSPLAQLAPLLDALCLHGLTAAQWETLQSLLREEPAARARYILYMEMHRQLHQHFSVNPARPLPLLDEQDLQAQDPRNQTQIFPAIADVAPDEEVLLTAPAVAPAAPPEKRLPILRIAAAAAILLGLGTGMAILRGTRSDKAGAAARLVFASNAAWTDSSLAVGDSVRPGRRMLSAGVIKLQFDGGADAIIEGPATFDPAASDHLNLELGKVTVSVREGGPANGPRFVVSTPHARVCDLGTEFGVSTDLSADTEVQVFRGSVTVAPADANATPAVPLLPILAGKSVRLDHDARIPVETPARPVFIREAELAARQSGGMDRALSNPTRQLLRDPRVAALYSFDAASAASAYLHELTHPDGTGEGEFSGVLWDAGRTPGSASLSYTHRGPSVKIYVPGAMPQLTLAAWVLDSAPLDFPGAIETCLLMTDERGTGAGYVHWQLLRGARITLSVMLEPGEPNYISAPLPALAQINRWHHIATVYDMPAGQVSFYLDGEKVSAVPLRNPRPLTIGHAQIGAWKSVVEPTSRRGFQGNLQDLVIFRAALSPGEIRDLAGSGR